MGLHVRILTGIQFSRQFVRCMSKMASRPTVYFDMSVGGQNLGRVEMQVNLCVALLCNCHAVAEGQGVNHLHSFGLQGLRGQFHGGWEGS